VIGREQDGALHSGLQSNPTRWGGRIMYDMHHEPIWPERSDTCDRRHPCFYGLTRLLNRAAGNNPQIPQTVVCTIM
jgi:hypothetical protein